MSVSPITNGAGNLIQNGRVKLWYHQDRLGSTDFLTDNVSGKVTSYVTYDSWGDPSMKAILKLGVRELDLTTSYTGHMYDPVLGVYYARARMYDAADRRFMAVDPAKEGYNIYSYCNNNPIKYTDPTGMFLAGMSITEGARGDNVSQINTALINHRMRHISELDARYIDVQSYSAITTNAVKRFQRDEGLVVTGDVDEATWRMLGLKLNTTLQEEFLPTPRGNATISVSAQGNRIYVTYKPKIHMENDYFTRVRCTNGTYLSDDTTSSVYDEKTTVRVDHRSLEYLLLLNELKKGFLMWEGIYTIHGITAAVSVRVNETHAHTRLWANLKVGVNRKSYQMVTSTIMWSVNSTPQMILNFGEDFYWKDRANGKPSVYVKHVAAHEFGHVLGVFDAYKYPANPVESLKPPPDGVMRETTSRKPIITAEEIKMMLYAFNRGVLQTYEVTWYGGEVSNAYYIR